MKNIKLVLIAVFLATAIVNQAATDGFTHKPLQRIINLTFDQAIHNPLLVVAMSQQLDGAFLLNNQITYTASVVFMNYTYRIAGSYEQWEWFIRTKMKYKGNLRSDIRSR